MCGIAGFFAHRQVGPAVIRQMFNSLQRRGPDAQHAMLWDEQFRPTSGAAHNALLHTRLSIRDPRPEADQPMHNDAKDIWICYNGEVYGWEKDAELLANEGFKFRTRSDTEFILFAYQAWGLDALLPKLRGMFALVILDLRTRKLHLIRDRMGLKPLIYYWANGEFAFGSTVRSVLPFLPKQQRALSEEGIDAYLAHRYVPAPRTVFKNIQRLENGHRLCLDIDTTKLEKRCYWFPQPLAGDWRGALDEAIRLRTASDRPVGVFLSGGVDSAVIASRLSALGYGNIKTFTAGFPSTSYDESAEAAALASQLGMPNQCIPIEQDLERDFSTLVRDLDEPFADPSAIPTWYLARETVRQATVVLGGDGGDELFGGYKRYRQHMRSAWRRRIRTPFANLAALQLSRPRKLVAESSLAWEDAYALRFSGFAPWQRAALQPNLTRPQNVYWRRNSTPSGNPMTTLLQTDFDNYLPEYILRKADLCTMAHGLELRAPLLDHVFVQHILGLDINQRFTDPAKRLLVTAAPEAVDALNRKKRGFNPPLSQWLTDDLSQYLDELSPRLSARSNGQLDATAIREVTTRYARGENHFAEQLLQLLILDESLGQLIDLAQDNDA
jgi:asparagine synthase (glutamine-hydrolysing)